MLVIGGRFDGEKGLLRPSTDFVEVNAGACLNCISGCTGWKGYFMHTLQDVHFILR